MTDEYTFEEDLSYGQNSIELALLILRENYPVEFIRLDSGGEADKELSVDVLAKFTDRTEPWAFKARRPKHIKWGDITIELRNGTGERGDWFRFKSGLVQRYVYFWRENKHIHRLVVLNAKKLCNDIPLNEFWGAYNEDIRGVGKIRFNKNKKHGKSTFTCIQLKNIIEKHQEIIDFLYPQTILTF